MSTASIVIPTHNRREKVRRLLGDLDRQDYKGIYEVIVVDDGSTDGTEFAVLGVRARYPLRYLCQPCRGPAAARNAGIRAAMGEYVILLDDDMRVAPSLVKVHLETHAECGECVVIGPGWLPEDAPATPFVRYRKWLDRLSDPATGGLALTRVPAVSSANTSVRRSLLVDLGLYCEELGLPGAEEAELSWRLARAQVPIVYNASIPAFQDDTPLTFASYCLKHARYGMAGAEVVNKLPHVAEGLGSLRSLVAVNGPLAAQDSLATVARKTVKDMLSRRAGLAVVGRVVALVERVLPAPVVLWSVYRAALSLYIFRGFRTGLAAPPRETRVPAGSHIA